MMFAFDIDDIIEVKALTVLYLHTYTSSLHTEMSPIPRFQSKDGKYGRAVRLEDLLASYAHNKGGIAPQSYRSSSTSIEMNSYLSPDRQDSPSAIPTIALSPLRQRESSFKFRNSGSFKSCVEALSEASQTENSFKLIRSASFRPQKTSFVPKENSRGIAVSEIILYLPLSDFNRSPESVQEEVMRREEKARQESFQNVFKSYTGDFNKLSWNSKRNQLENEFLAHQISLCDNEKVYCERDCAESIAMSRKSMHKCDNSNLLSRAALALSRYLNDIK